MVYEKQGFVDGQVLTAAQMNHLENGVADVATKTKDIPAYSTATQSVNDSLSITLPENETVCNGKQITFKTPVDSTVYTTITIENVVYTLVTASGECIPNGTLLWKANSMVSVVLDCSTNKAYVQNAEHISFGKTYVVDVPINWTAASTGYTQTIDVPGILAVDQPIADVMLTGDADADLGALGQWALIHRITTENGSITLYAYESAPTGAFTIQLKGCIDDGANSGGAGESSSLSYSYGTEDLVAGQSALATGQLYFVYE